MVKREEFYLPSSDGSSKIHGVSWKPEGEIRGTLQIIHGMTEYILRYDEFAVYLAKRGIAVVGHDHLGHGQSSKEENLGFFAEKKGGACLLKDIHRVSEIIEKRYEKIPHVMMGHSMGSFLLRRYLTLYEEPLAGAIMMGTGNQALPLILAGRGVAALTSKIKGPYYRSELLHQMVQGSYNKAFRPNRTAVDWLSRDEAVTDRYMADSLCTFRFTCGAYLDFFGILKDLKLKRQFEKIPKELPLLLIAGEKDPVGDSGKGVKAVYKQFQKLGIKDITLKLYPEARHEVLNETNRAEVYEYLYDWICERL